MVPLIALAIFTVGIAGLFWLDRDKSLKASPASWLPTVWLAIGGSRNVGEWLNVGVRIDATAAHVDGNPIDKFALGLLLFFGFVVLVRRRAQVAEILLANKAVLLYVTYCLVSLIWSDVPMVGLRRWFRMTGDIMMVLVILSDPAPTAALKRVLARVAFILVPVSLLLIRYYPDMGRSYGVDGSIFWTGVATGKNGLGIVCFVFGFTSVWRFIIAYRDRHARNRRRQMLAHGLVTLVALYLLQVANSMTSLACFGISMSLFLATTKRRRTNADDGTTSTAVTQPRNPVFVHAIVITSVLVVGSVLFLGAGGSVLESMGRDPTLTGRTVIWEIALGFVRSPWFGEGYESFWTPERIADMAKAHASLTQAHNGYIEVYLNLGLMGIALLAIVIFAGYRKAAAQLRHDPDTGSLRLVFLVIALIYNCTEGAFKFMTPVWFNFLLGAIESPRAAVESPRAAVARESVTGGPWRRSPQLARTGRRAWRSA